MSLLRVCKLEVVTAEILPYRFCHTRFCRYASSHYILPRPTVEPQKWEDTIMRIVETEAHWPVASNLRVPPPPLSMSTRRKSYFRSIFHVQVTRCCLWVAKLRYPPFKKLSGRNFLFRNVLLALARKSCRRAQGGALTGICFCRMTFRVQ